MNSFLTSSEFSQNPSNPTPSRCVLQRTTLNQLTTVRWSVGQALREYQRAGLPAIGISWRKLNETGRLRNIRLIKNSGLPVSSLGWVGGFTGANQHPHEDAISEAKRAIRVAAQLGAASLTVVTGPHGGHIHSNACRLVVDALKALGELAARCEVPLALQPMHSLYQRNWSFVNRLDETLEILDRVDNPTVKLAFNPYHLWEETNLIDRIPELVPRIAAVTLADWKDDTTHENDRAIPGQGSLPVNPIVSRLEQFGYSGWYEIEVWSQALWKLRHRDLMQHCRSAAIDIDRSVTETQAHSG